MSSDLVVREEAGLLADDVLQPVMSLQLAKQRLAEFQGFVKEYLREGEDFGTIPGTPKPTLYKPGADKLCELYGLSDSYEIVDKTEDFDASLFDYTIKCVLTRIRTQLPISTGLGSCNSYEGKYRWREAQRKCPKCGKEAIIKGKEEYGGGWLCFAKKGGCGAKFADTDQSIIEQAVGRIENDDIATLKNTILKMAKKRAKIDATLAATRSSGIFTQDIEDITTDAPSPPSKPKIAKGPVGDVMCSECRAINGHLPNCPLRKTDSSRATEAPNPAPAPQTAQNTPKASAQPPAGANERMVLKINTVTPRSRKGKDGQEQPYLVLTVIDKNNNEWDLYVWDKKLHERAGTLGGKTCLVEFSEKKAANNRVYCSLEAILEVAGEQQVVEAEPPLFEDMR
jgi:hypothetical protein